MYLGAAATGGGLIVAAAVAGLGEFVVWLTPRTPPISAMTMERGAIRAVWTALFSPDLITSALVVALGGAVVARWPGPGCPTVRLSAGWEGARREAGSPSRPARLVRAAALIAAGSC